MLFDILQTSFSRNSLVCLVRIDCQETYWTQHLLRNICRQDKRQEMNVKDTKTKVEYLHL